MKNHKLIEAIDNMNDKYLEEAISYQAKKKVKFNSWQMLGTVAACLCLLAGIGTQQYHYHYSVDSVVDIDINPSIELAVSKSERVLSAKALNDDAKIVLEGMQLENVDLDTAMNAIIGSLLKNGYLDEVYNAINVCVANDDEEAGAELGQKLTEEISNLLEENALVGKVLAQTQAADEKLAEQAMSYGVSEGKLALAKQVSECTGTELEEAVELSISELWDLSDAERAELITKEAALEIVYADAGVNAETAVLLKNVIEETEGTFIYRIEFVVEETKLYKYKIDAENGSILKSTCEYREKEEVEVPEDSEVQLLTKKAVLEIVYADAGVTHEEVRLWELKLERGEVAAYCVEFSVGKCEYEYLVNAVDGTIISKKNPFEDMNDKPEMEMPDDKKPNGGRPNENKPNWERPEWETGVLPEESQTEEETEEENEEQTESVTEEFPVVRPGDEGDRFPQDRPQGESETVPEERPGGENGGFQEMLPGGQFGEKPGNEKGKDLNNQNNKGFQQFNQM